MVARQEAAVWARAAEAQAAAVMGWVAVAKATVVGVKAEELLVAAVLEQVVAERAMEAAERAQAVVATVATQAKEAAVTAPGAVATAALVGMVVCQEACGSPENAEVSTVVAKAVVATEWAAVAKVVVP